MSNTFICRPYKTTDLESILSLFYITVHTINIKDYSPKQIEIWASSILNKERWSRLLEEHYTYVVEFDKNIIGFSNITHEGSLEHLYVNKNFQGQRIATLLLKAIEKKAQELKLNEIITESSITAKPFFEKRGFKVIQEQEKIYHGTYFINYQMRKIIDN